MLGRRIAARQPRPICLPVLRRTLLDEWCNIPQDHIDTLILIMPKRLLTARVSRGKEIFASRAAIEFSFGEGERPAQRRSN
ncbi:hypothetical protein TNCV_4917741 [Trichonephila clavipes]|nr:hypothetical protein TNCV_4917741 [Trichonephila clavipes]